MNDLSSWVKNNFEFVGQVTVKPLRSYTNDVFEIKNREKHLLKIYGEGWKTEAEILWEIELLEFLKENSIAVPAVVKGKTDKKVLTIDINGNNRHAVMFEWAKGKKPTPPFSLNDYELLGKAIAKIHKVSDNFKSDKQRQQLGIDYLINKPLLIIINACGNDKNKLNYFQNTADKFRDYLREFASKGLDFGVVHDDVTFDNIHITDNKEIIFYDFDSGGLGWRAIDLQGWAVFDPKTALKQTSFIKGYRTIREISDNDITASSYLHAANEFWGTGLDLERRILKKGEKAINKYLSEKINTFDTFLKYFEQTRNRI